MNDWTALREEMQRELNDVPARAELKSKQVKNNMAVVTGVVYIVSPAISPIILGKVSDPPHKYHLLELDFLSRYEWLLWFFRSLARRSGSSHFQ